ncbi:MAG: hypothetical protein DRG78_03695 [Epsilonproteobacteria bacterium]|nr:MAG: hypothetical protein DRG78_03695 [Campylobacterota bacterium]
MDNNEVDTELKRWIDKASYHQLLQRNRFGKLGDKLFIDATGQYFMETMSKKRAELSNDEQVAISKQIGWEPED